MVTFKKAGRAIGSSLGEQAAGEVTGEVAGEVTDEVKALLNLLMNPLNRKEMQEKLALKGQANFRERYLEPSLKQGLIEMTQPESPKSPTQKYRLTKKRRGVFKEEGEGIKQAAPFPELPADRVSPVQKTR